MRFATAAEVGLRVTGFAPLLLLRSGHLILRGELDAIRDEARELPAADDEEQEQLDGGDRDRDVRRGAPRADERVGSLERMIHGRSFRPCGLYSF